MIRLARVETYASRIDDGRAKFDLSLIQLHCIVNLALLYAYSAKVTGIRKRCDSDPPCPYNICLAIASLSSLSSKAFFDM